jgi:alpha-glucosidase
VGAACADKSSDEVADAHVEVSDGTSAGDGETTGARDSDAVEDDGHRLNDTDEDVAGPPTTGALIQCASARALPSWVAQTSPRSVAVNCESGVVLHVTAVAPHTLRLRYQGSQPDPRPDRSYAVVAKADESTHFAAVSTDNGARFCTELLVVDVEASACRLVARDVFGSLLLEDDPSGGYAEGPDPQVGPDSWNVRVSRVIAQNEHFYGFGERNGALDKRGAAMTFWNSDVPGYGPQADPLYQSVPFFVGLRGFKAYGLLTDNSSRMHMDMGAGDPGHYLIKAPMGELDQYLIAGPAISQVLERYTWLTGRMPLPPKWALGYHQARHGYYPDTVVMEVAKGLREHNFPADGMWLDIDYMDGFRVWTWSPEFFPNPAKLIADLKAMGIKTTVIIDPGVKVDDAWEVYNSGLALGAYVTHPDGTPFVGSVWPGDSVYPDFTNPAVRDWWADLTAWVNDTGVDGIWLDMNEPANFNADYQWTVPPWTMTHGEGTPMTMAEAHNVYGSGMCWATFEGLRKARPESRPFLLTRAGYAGVQRYAAVWTGDTPSTWPALETTVAMMLNMGLSGVSFVGSDAGGWMGGASAELFTRWMQVGSLSPFFRNHTQKQAEWQEPWKFGIEAEIITRRSVEERYRLMPYWYALFEESSRTGAPIIRPMVYEFQNDGVTHTVGDQFMLGPWILAAPVLAEGAKARTLYLPAGRWFEYGSGAVHTGPGLTTVGLRLGALPLFIRDGAIIPKQQLVQWTDQAPVNPLTLDLYPAASPSTFTLYEDDGKSMLYVMSAHTRRTRYTLQQTATGARLSFSSEGGYLPAARTLSMRVRRVDYWPEKVTLGGTDLPAYATWEAFEKAGQGWIYDDRDLSLRVKIVDPLESGSETVVNFTYAPGLVEAAPPVAVHFRVTVPQGTDTSQPVTIALSSNDWTHQALEWSAGNVAEGKVLVPRGEWFDYKFARGGWETVEKYGDCSEAKNRYGFGKAHPVREDTVETWADACN